MTIECPPARRRWRAAAPCPAIPSAASSTLQAYEPNYRWDKNYRLNQDELTKGSGAATQQVRSSDHHPASRQVPSSIHC